MVEVDPSLAMASGIAAMLACAFGGGLGLYAMINPAWASGLVRLIPLDGKVEGKSEFRATYGGLFFAGHAFALWALATEQSGAAMAAAAIGAGWVGSAGGRLVSFAADKAATGLNVFNVLFELVIGLALLAPLGLLVLS